ncbi:MAG: hypothetical protein VKJ64_22165 [Leptolyngbyaceae bacterium]|nr:hypothetical protein [Leptolyngbyaceae bacterium]
MLRWSITILWTIASIQNQWHYRLRKSVHINSKDVRLNLWDFGGQEIYHTTHHFFSPNTAFRSSPITVSLAGNARQQTNQTVNQAPNRTLAETAKEIQDLLVQLDQTYDHTSPIGRMEMVTEMMKSVDKNPTLKARVINALKEGGTTALEEAIEHPAVKPVVAALKGFMDAE